MSTNMIRYPGDADVTVFEVYAFVDVGDDSERESWTFREEDEAREFADGLRGADMSSVSQHEHASPAHKAARRFDLDGEVSEVEIHERPAEYVSVPKHHLNELISAARQNEEMVNSEWPGSSDECRELGRIIRENSESVE